MVVAVAAGIALMVAQGGAPASGLLELCEKFPGHEAGASAVQRVLMGKANATETNEALQALSCKTYMWGFLDALSAEQTHSTLQTGAKTTGVCIPDGVTTDQSIRVVVKYMQDNPKHLHQPRHVVAFMALFEAFPCQSGQRPPGP